MLRALIVVIALGACASIGSGTGGGGDDENDDTSPPKDEETPECTTGCEVDGLDSAIGCGGVYNPDQLLDYHFTMKASDWSGLKNDSTNSVYYPATFQCGTDAALPFQVGIRRKRSGGSDKPGLKVDFHEYEPGGSHFSLKKLSFETGQSSGTTSVMRMYVMREYLAWRIMTLSKTISSRSAFARVYVNGELIGLYVNVEQVDKRFLRSRGKDDGGWLFKQSGSTTDGYKTNETMANPYEARVCFLPPGSCPVPSAQELATELPVQVDIDQMLHMGGVNAFLANIDGPITKANNYYFYDDPLGAPRLFVPVDLDTTQIQSDGVFEQRRPDYTDVLWTNWEDDYDQLLTTLITGPLSLAAIDSEIDRIETVAAAAFDEDLSFPGEAFAPALAGLRSYWASRHSQISAELAAHAP